MIKASIDSSFIILCCIRIYQIIKQSQYQYFIIHFAIFIQDIQLKEMDEQWKPEQQEEMNQEEEGEDEQQEYEPARIPDNEEAEQMEEEPIEKLEVQKEKQQQGNQGNQDNQQEQQQQLEEEQNEDEEQEQAQQPQLPQESNQMEQQQNNQENNQQNKENQSVLKPVEKEEIKQIQKQVQKQVQNQIQEQEVQEKKLEKQVQEEKQVQKQQIQKQVQKQADKQVDKQADKQAEKQIQNPVQMQMQIQKPIQQQKVPEIQAEPKMQPQIQELQPQKQKKNLEVVAEPLNIPSKVSKQQNINRLISYANKLQKQLQVKQKIISEINSSISLKDGQIFDLKNNTEKLQRIYQDQFTKAKQLERSNNQLNLQLNTTQKKATELQDQLVAYREIGDIRSLLAKVDELVVLVQTQQKQLEFLREKSESTVQNNQNMIIQKFTKQQIQKIEELSLQKQQLISEVQSLSRQLQEQQKLNQQNNRVISDLDSQMKQKMQEVQTGKNQLSQQNLLITQLQTKFTEVSTKLRQLEQQPRNDQSSRTLTQKQIRQQKQAFFRDYKSLQSQYIGLQEVNYDLKNKMHSIRLELKTILKTKVNKKDYDEIVHKYRKVKDGLQRVIQENKKLKRALESNNNEAQQIGQNIINDSKNITILQNYEQNDNLQQYMHVFNKHIKQSLGYFKTSNQIMEQVYLQKYQNKIDELKNIITQQNNKIQRLQRANLILQKQLIFKNNIINDVVSENSQLRTQFSESIKKRQNLQWELLDSSKASSSLKKLQTGSLALVTKNRRLKTENQTWKSLYSNLKVQYQTFIKRDHNQQQPQGVNKDSSQMLNQGQEGDQNNDKKQNNKKNMEQEEIVTRKQAVDIQTQTDGISQYYFKELKEVLSILKKFPDKTKKLMQGIQSKKNQLQEIKTRYDTVLHNYNVRFRDLQVEKNKNQTWRSQCKEEIIGQFQEIRELVQNQRLINSLRKAKNLIQALEKEEGQADQ